MKQRLLLLTLWALSGTQALAGLSGTVTDLGGHGLKGVGVSLAAAGNATTTNAEGAWSISPSTGLSPRSIGSGFVRWTGKAIELRLLEPSSMSVKAYDLRGAVLRSLSGVKLGAGSHILPMPIPATGMVWLRVTIGDRTETVLAGMGRASPPAVLAPIPARSMAFADTLRFSWKSKVFASIRVSNPDSTGILVKVDTSTWDILARGDSGVFTDARDGKQYRWIQIGTQRWMGQNLNFKPAGADSGICYNNSVDSCAKYGRLYNWPTLMAGYSSSKTRPSGVQGICPQGWHVPSDSEWTTLVNTVEEDKRVGARNAGKALKSASGWYYGSDGTDIFGFRALPGGTYFNGFITSFYGLGGVGLWGSATEADSEYSRIMYLDSFDTRVYQGSHPKVTYHWSLRCLEGAGEPLIVRPDSTLDSLLLSTGILDPTFHKRKYTYAVSLNDSDTSVTVTGKSKDSTNKVTYSEDSLSYSPTGNTIHLVEGQAKSIFVKVTTTIKTSTTYKVYLYRKVSRSAGDSGIYTDPRDKANYTWVKIGKQVWMARNLNYIPPGSDSGWCYNHSLDSCAKYGRLYNWTRIMAGASSTWNHPSGVQGLCPPGWHVPSTIEWDSLNSTLEANPLIGFNNAAKGLKSREGWTSSGNGLDLYGFHALPAGYFMGSVLDYFGGVSFWWSATSNQDWALNRQMGSSETFYQSFCNKAYKLSLRCLEN